MMSPVAALDILAARYRAPGAMEFSSPFFTLIAVMLSARTKDESVLPLLAQLFRAFPNAQAFAAARPEEVAPYINTIGLYRQKARHAVAAARIIVEQHGGKVPATMADLVALPGVGRKTASVLLAALFGIPAIAVDTHVHRVANRLGWVRTSTPAATEQALRALVPEGHWRTINRVMVPFGRELCTTPQPRCFACPLVAMCAFGKKQLTAPEDAEVALARAHAREEAIIVAHERVENELRDIPQLMHTPPYVAPRS